MDPTNPARSGPQIDAEKIDAWDQAIARADGDQMMEEILTSSLDGITYPPMLYGMAHLIKTKPKLLSRVRRIRGQVEAIERALESEIGCADVLMLVASVRGAINGLTAELMEDHIRHHVVDPAHDPDPNRAKGAAELIDVVRTYLK
jgi:DNA-binding FrmR family transcriptional regulator